MNAVFVPIPALAAAPELARRFGVILAAMLMVVARRFVREPRLILLNVPVWRWLSQAIWRFARALTRPVVVRASRAGRVMGARTARQPLPGARGWLLRELGWEIAVYRSQLEDLLAEPDMRAALVAMPGAGRVLRPLCRMLGVDVPGGGVAGCGDGGGFCAQECEAAGGAGGGLAAEGLAAISEGGVVCAAG